VFVVVSLSDPERDVAAYVSKAAEHGPRDWWQALARVFSLRDRRLLAVSELERARMRADQAHARLADFLPVRQARGVELQWLIRRAFCRGLGEPDVDGLHEPRALVFERNGAAVLAPLEGDVLRWGSLVPFRWFLSRRDSWLYRWDSRQSLLQSASLSAGVEVSLEASSRDEKSGKVSLGRGAPLNRQAPRSRQDRWNLVSASRLVLPSSFDNGEGREAGWRCRAPKVSSPASQKPSHSSSFDELPSARGGSSVPLSRPHSKRRRGKGSRSCCASLQ